MLAAHANNKEKQNTHKGHSVFFCCGGLKIRGICFVESVQVLCLEGEKLEIVYPTVRFTISHNKKTRP